MNEQGLILKQEVTKVETERVQYKTSKGAEKDEVLYKVWQKFTWIDIETGDKDENDVEKLKKQWFDTIGVD